MPMNRSCCHESEISGWAAVTKCVLLSSVRSDSSTVVIADSASLRRVELLHNLGTSSRMAGTIAGPGIRTSRRHWFAIRKGRFPRSLLRSAMLKSRHRPLNLFALVPHLGLHFETQLEQLDRLLDDDDLIGHRDGPRCLDRKSTILRR